MSLGNNLSAFGFGDVFCWDFGCVLQYLIGEVDTPVKVLVVIRELCISVGIGEVVDVCPSLVIVGIVTYIVKVGAVSLHRPAHFTGGIAVAVVELGVCRGQGGFCIFLVSPKVAGSQLVGRRNSQEVIARRKSHCETHTCYI